MASSIKEIIQATFLKLYDSEALDVFIEMAELQTSACFFGSKYNLAVSLRACHNYELHLRDYHSSGNATSLEEGDLSQGFSTPKDSNNLGQTSWGMQLQDLINSSGLGMVVTGVIGGLGCDS